MAHSKISKLARFYDKHDKMSPSKFGFSSHIYHFSNMLQDADPGSAIIDPISWGNSLRHLVSGSDRMVQKCYTFKLFPYLLGWIVY